MLGLKLIHVSNRSPKSQSVQFICEGMPSYNWGPETGLQCMPMSPYGATPSAVTVLSVGYDLFTVALVINYFVYHISIRDDMLWHSMCRCRVRDLNLAITLTAKKLSFNKRHLKMAYPKWRRFCLGHNVLMGENRPLEQSILFACHVVASSLRRLLGNEARPDNAKEQ